MAGSAAFQLSDEVELMDFQHMAEVTAATAEAVRILANGPRPEWKEGGMPEPRGGDR